MRLKFREMNPVVVGIVGIAVVLLVLFGSFQLVGLPFIAGTTYEARLVESGRLKAGDTVVVAGTEVGEVQSVEIDTEAADVEVMFTAKGVVLGDLTSASVKTATVLGERRLALEPRGARTMNAGDVIPTSRTTPGYSVSRTVEDLTRRTSEIDSGQVGKALDTFSETFKNTPDDIEPALTGVSRLSQTIASRDDELRLLLDRAESVTGLLRKHTGDLTRIITDGNLLLGELERRRGAIRELLVTATQAADQATGLVKEQQDILKPALDELNGAVSVLRRNEQNISSAVQRVSGFITGLGEGLSAGPNFSGHTDVGEVPGYFPVANFIPGLALPLPQTPGAPSLGGLLGNGANR